MKSSFRVKSIALNTELLRLIRETGHGHDFNFQDPSTRASSILFVWTKGSPHPNSIANNAAWHGLWDIPKHLVLPHDLSWGSVEVFNFVSGISAEDSSSEKEKEREMSFLKILEVGKMQSTHPAISQQSATLPILSCASPSSFIPGMKLLKWITISQIAMP